MVRFCFLILVSSLTASAFAVDREDEREEKDGFLRATFAGGCFWCMEPPFDKIDGVVLTTVGYTGGRKPNPSYEEISTGNTGHTEAVQVVYDPSLVSYQELLQTFWRNVDPTKADRQFCDVGNQYRPGIFYHDETQRLEAERSLLGAKRKLMIEGSFVTEITPLQNFYRAEEYHQDYYKKNPLRYRMYRFNCGRDKRLQELWGDGGGKIINSQE